MTQYLNVTNPTSKSIEIAGRTLAPGASYVFDAGLVPEIYQKYSTPVKNKPVDQDLFIRKLKYADFLLEKNDSDEERFYCIVDYPNRPIARLVNGIASWMTEAKVDSLTGGIGILGPNGKQIAGNGAPYDFTSSALANADNGMVRTCSTAQVATVNTGLVAGFATLFDGPVSFNGTATITDDRDVVSGKNYCTLYAIGVDTYRVVGKKGA